jgi:hypothetical protein
MEDQVFLVISSGKSITLNAVDYDPRANTETYLAKLKLGDSLHGVFFPAKGEGLKEALECLADAALFVIPHDPLS